MSLFAREQEVVADAVDVASDKTMDYGSIALSKADEATSVAARATANKVAEVGSWLHQVHDIEPNYDMPWTHVLHMAHRIYKQAWLIGCSNYFVKWRSLQKWVHASAGGM